MKQCIFQCHTLHLRAMVHPACKYLICRGSSDWWGTTGAICLDYSGGTTALAGLNFLAYNLQHGNWIGIHFCVFMLSALPQKVKNKIEKSVVFCRRNCKLWESGRMQNRLD